MPAWWGWAPSVFGTAFCFVLGAAIGSFLNVVAYRLPKGEGLFAPPSRCPRCETRLRWRQNLPVLGWILLRGRCRYCRSPISIQYPLIEFITGAIFAFLFAAWFGQTAYEPWLGGALRPDWAGNGLARGWPFLGVVCTLVAGLIAMTLIDARTFMIPLSIPWFVTAVALVAHPLHAIVVAGRWRTDWTIPTPTSAEGVLAGVGGILGVGAYALLLSIGVLKRSYADYEQWAAGVNQAKDAGVDATGSTDSTPPPDGETALGPLLLRVFYFTGPAVALMAAGYALGLRIGRPLESALAGTLLGMLIGVGLRRLAPGANSVSSSEPEWIGYPHARREALKEMIPIAGIASCMGLGWLAGGAFPHVDPPLWLEAFAGAAMGYLVGGGLVWLVRVFGSLAFGKEAMGMGDVHLLAAVGATLGWLDPVLAFFTAPFFGLAWVLGASLFARRKGVSVALPFGPHLAAGTLTVVLLWPAYERLLAALLPATP